VFGYSWAEKVGVDQLVSLAQGFSVVGMNLPLSTSPEDGSVEGSTEASVDNSVDSSIDPGLEAAFHLQVDLSERGLVTGHDIRVIKCDGGDLDETQRKSEYGGRKRVTGATVLAAIRNGFSVVVRSAHFRSSICASLTHALEDDLGLVTTANVYLTPPYAQGLPRHSDDHDVMVLQVSGSKVWELGDDIEATCPSMTGGTFSEIKPGSRVRTGSGGATLASSESGSSIGSLSGSSSESELGSNLSASGSSTDMVGRQRPRSHTGSGSVAKTIELRQGEALYVPAGVVSHRHSLRLTVTHFHSLSLTLKYTPNSRYPIPPTS